MKITKKKLFYFIPIAIIIIQNIINMPFYTSKINMNADDFIFHMNRLVGLENVFQSPVNFSIFAHNGKAINLFYPYMPLMLFKFIYELTKNFTYSYKIFVFTYMSIGVYISYFSAYKYKKVLLMQVYLHYYIV